jgi:ArsR family metal-binding transcriptional regulator
MSGLLVTTFPRRPEFLKAKAFLESQSLPYRVVTPSRGYEVVAVPALVVDSEVRFELARREAGDLICSGWVDYRPAVISMPEDEPATFLEDVLGKVAVMVLAICVADETRVRIIAHISGDLTDVFPYLNAEMREARYNPNAPNLTFMEQYRIVTLYPHRITIAKADEIVDVWRLLEAIRRRINQVWAHRGEVTPSYQMRQKPPALEIYKRLPRTNCKSCGVPTCLAFAVKLWTGQGTLSECKPVWAGTHAHLKDALIEICAGLGISHGE